LRGKKISKMITYSLMALVLLFTFSLINACRTGVAAGDAEQPGTEEAAPGESMDEEAEGDTEDAEDGDAAEEAEADDDREEDVAGYMDITAAEAKELIDNNPDLIIIDVSPLYEDGHIPGAVNYYIGDGSLDEAIPALDPEGKYLVYCHTDAASIPGAQKLVDAGFKNVYRLAGNFAAWADAGYEIEKGGEMADMNINSPAFSNNEDIPPKYTCDSDNINPELDFSGVPPDAVSLVLIMDDPDAPGGTWVHWTLFNIDPATAGIDENSVPAGAVQGSNSWGTQVYGGPCPPSGTHRYFFKLYALDTSLDLDPTATASDIEDAMQGHILANAELIGLYSRS